MSNKLQTPRGTHDLYSYDMRSHLNIIEMARKTSLLFGFEEIDTPIFEFTNVFARTLGDASDIVNKEMYCFEDRGGEKLTLRPEGTAGIARAFVSNGLTRQTPMKFFYQGPMFRYERPQKGRQRQFHQIGAELIGADSPSSDIEIIEMAHMFLQSLGLKDLVLEINSIGDQESRENYRTALIDYYKDFKKDLSEDSQRRLETNPLRILDSKSESDININQGAPKLSEYLNDESLKRYNTIKSGLKQLGIAYSESDQLVRGLDYYSHVVFEFKSGDLGAQNTVLAGGRYNDLVDMMGGPKTACVGWACGIERLSIILNQKIEPQRPVHLIPLGEAAEKYSHSVLREIRQAGIPSEMSFSGNMGKRMKKANQKNAFAAIIIGDNELKDQKASIKFFDSGEQKKVSFADLVKTLQENL